MRATLVILRRRLELRFVSTIDVNLRNSLSPTIYYLYIQLEKIIEMDRISPKSREAKSAWVPEVFAKANESLSAQNLASDGTKELE